MGAFRTRGFVGSDNLVVEWLAGEARMHGEISDVYVRAFCRTFAFDYADFKKLL